MAKAKKSTAKANDKAAAPVSKASVKPVEKTSPKKVLAKRAETKNEKLVTNIVAVKAPMKKSKIKEPTSTNGVIKMTKTTEKKVETAQAETFEAAKNFFADVKVKAKEAAEKGREYMTEAGTVAKANFEAVTESGKIAAKGTQDLAKENIEYAKTNFAEAQAAVKSLTAVKSPTEFVTVQTEIARKGFDTMVAQGSKNTETMIKLFGDAFQPLSNRMAVAKDFFSKAA